MSSIDKLFLPLEFGRVSSSIYRSAYPANRTFPYVSKLSLKSIICLNSTDLREDLRQFCKSNNIILQDFDIGSNLEPFVCMKEDAMQAAIQFSLNPLHQPCLVFCTNGKNKTSTFVGCYRKMNGWCYASIALEYEQFTGTESSLLDLQFIDGFIMR